MSDESSQTHNKVVRLFTYLEKALALDDNVIRDFRASILEPSPWWVADYPDDLDNLYIRRNGPEDDASLQDGTILRVQKKDIEKAPPLPDELQEWIVDIIPLEKPKTKDRIDRKTQFSDNQHRIEAFRDFTKDYQTGDVLPDSLEGWVTFLPDKTPEKIKERYIEDPFKNHPELEDLLIKYIDNEWSPWAERTTKAYKANLLYDQLYSLRLLLKNEGDRYELVYGQGLLTWKRDDEETIYSPVFLTPLVLDFNAITRTIQISQDSMLKSFVELAALQELGLPAEMDIVTWSDKINADPFDFWHYESLKIQSQFLINTLSNNSEDQFSPEIISAPTLTATPSIWNAPIIFIRNRNNDLWAKYAGLIRRDIERNDILPTDFIADLVGDYSTERLHSAGNDDNDKRAEIKESELFFPLPWNDEQKRIAERINSNYGVVVKGPPGTGKSHTIANLISRFLAEGKTVLVTSQTSKALDVLRDKLPENIKSLAVTQLQQSAKQDQVLQESIAEISSNLGERHTKFSESQSEKLRKELHDLRQEKATLANKIRSYILTDSQQSLVIDNEQYTPIRAAKFVAESKRDDDRISLDDEIRYDTELPFGEDELHKLHDLSNELSDLDRNLYQLNLPRLDTLPSDEIVDEAFSTYRSLEAKLKRSDAIFAQDPNIKPDDLEKLRLELEGAKKSLSSINEEYQREIFQRCLASDSEKQTWHAILKKIFTNLQKIKSSEELLLGHEVSGSLEISHEHIVDAITTLKTRVADGAKISMRVRILLSPLAKQVLNTYRVDGHQIETVADLELILAALEIEVAQKEIRIVLAQSFSKINSAPKFIDIEKDTLALDLLVRGLAHLVLYPDRHKTIYDFCHNNRELSTLSYVSIDDINTLLDVLESYSAKYQIQAMQALFREWQKALENTRNNQSHEITDRIVRAIENKRITEWNTLMIELKQLHDTQQKAIQFHELTQLIQPLVPKLYRRVIDVSTASGSLSISNLRLAWNIARLESWLNAMHDGVDVDNMQRELERLSKKEFELNADLVTVMAWQSQIDRVTKQQRDALMMWSHEMRQYGKGTGKYAFRHLRAAQEALRYAKNAVPVWIMPLNRVAQMFSEPKAGMFDVVIFDEASQCDIKGINVGYLGKKLLVVGDPEQISPGGLFQNQEKIFELISRFLFDIPYRESFSVTASLFDLAKIRLSNIIQLNEHFRCVPEIIAFSNRHVYESKLQPLRYPQPKGQLKPPLVPIFVENGYQNTNNKANVPEAEAIVNKLEELLKDPDYQTRPDGRICTFGVISLLAEDQAKYIGNLIRERFDEKTIEERRITCGDAYAFQGDERDVMLLSMVKAHDPNKPDETFKPLTSHSDMQRFNVAASRARDQMFLFHSFPLSSLHNENDWRLKLLSWFYNPIAEELNVGREALKKEFDIGRASQFSVDVGNLIIDRGYKVIPEYPVIGYRIDLVVQGATSRLAVECDGDQYHTLETWDNEQARERQLRRAGWEFWRLTGSSFYRYKDKALSSLWEKLEEMDIKPI